MGMCSTWLPAGVLVLLLTLGDVCGSTEPQVIPLDEWHCGSHEWDKQLAHQLVHEKPECALRAVEANKCCLTHDICYVEHHSQKECDASFCSCLAHAFPENCTSVANTFCFMVELFGETAHKNSYKKYPSVSGVNPATPKPAGSDLAGDDKEGEVHSNVNVQDPKVYEEADKKVEDANEKKLDFLQRFQLVPRSCFLHYGESVDVCVFKFRECTLQNPDECINDMCQCLVKNLLMDHLRHSRVCHTQYTEICPSEMLDSGKKELVEMLDSASAMSIAEISSNKFHQLHDSENEEDSKWSSRVNFLFLDMSLLEATVISLSVVLSILFCLFFAFLKLGVCKDEQKHGKHGYELNDGPFSIHNASLFHQQSAKHSHQCSLHPGQDSRAHLVESTDDSNDQDVEFDGSSSSSGCSTPSTPTLQPGDKIEVGHDVLDTPDFKTEPKFT